MKSLFALALVCFSLLNVSSLRGDFQEEKIYIPHERLHFAPEGIFLQGNQGQLIHLREIHHDGSNYYLAGNRLHTLILKCKNCDAAYVNYCPQPCTNCDKSLGYYVVDFETIWDRS